MTNTSRSPRKGSAGRQFLLVVAAFAAFVAVTSVIFLRLYNSHMDGVLYAERLSQMQEVTTQLFAGLDDVVANQWKDAQVQCNYLERGCPATMTDLLHFMEKQRDLNELTQVNSNLVAVDEQGRYYTADGPKGPMGGMDYLLDEPARINYVFNTMTSGETWMLFLIRLPEPVPVQNGDRTVTLTYYGISRDMAELDPYFNCTAYDNSNSVYVIDDNGSKLFRSTGGDSLKGHNVFAAMSHMDYLHGSSFDSARAELAERGVAYSNALMNGEEYFYALYRMESAAWTLLFLVPSARVATNTVTMINTTVRLVLGFAIALVAASALIIFLLLRAKQRQALAVERRNSETLAAINDELTAAVKAADAANRAKSSFLANMSHDIRTPMNAIVGLTDLMSHEAGLSQRMRGYIEKTQISSRHLLSLINDILDMSRIESNGVVLNNAPLCLSQQLQQVDGIIRPQAAERDQTFRVRLHDVTHEYLIGDSMRLRQIFLNLLSNAVKYTPRGGCISLDLTELPCDTGGQAAFTFTVADNGYGMPPEFVSHIFEPFTRAENSTTNKIQGTGLGMAITKSIVDLMGGTITVESRPDEGSRFTVTLTLPVDPDGGQSAVPTPQETACGILNGVRFLCAEDNELNAEILQALLTMHGASCTICPDGAALVKAFADVRPGQYDAILMDVQMPHMNGLDAARAIRSGANPLGRTIPIIAMTANAFSEDVQAALNAGMNAHIAKPIDVSALERTLQALLPPRP